MLFGHLSDGSFLRCDTVQLTQVFGGVVVHVSRTCGEKILSTESDRTSDASLACCSLIAFCLMSYSCLTSTSCCARVCFSFLAILFYPKFWPLSTLWRPFSSTPKHAFKNHLTPSLAQYALYSTYLTRFLLYGVRSKRRILPYWYWVRVKTRCRHGHCRKSWLWSWNSSGLNREPVVVR